MHRGPKSRLALHVKSHYHYSLNNDIISNSEETVSLWKRLRYRCMHRIIASYMTCLSKNPDRGFSAAANIAARIGPDYGGPDSSWAGWEQMAP